MPAPEDHARGAGRIDLITLAWLVTSIFYFYQYALRSAPAVMMTDLTAAFGLGAVGITTLLGLLYYGYAGFSLVAGVAMDQLGPRKVVPLGAATVAVGALLFATGDPTLGGIGCFLRGAGGVFSLLGAVYLVTAHMPASRAATFIGITQMFGMAGGSAGQFLVGPILAGGLGWSQFWVIAGLAGFPIAILLFMFIPAREAAPAPAGASRWAGEAARGLAAVARNPQTWLCGAISGLMFMPTTIFDMVWGVRYLQEGHDLPFSLAVLRSASVPFGWIIGCPLMGWISDRIGRRRPVIAGGALLLLACLALILFAPPDLFPTYSLGLVAGIASGAAMLPYTVAKEVNPPALNGTATGLMNCLNFSMTALLGPLFAHLLTRLAAGGERELVHYQQAFQPLLYGVALAIALSFLLRETGPARRTRAFPGQAAGEVAAE